MEQHSVSFLPEEILYCIWKAYYGIVLNEMKSKYVDISYKVISGITPIIENESTICRCWVFKKTMLALEDTYQFYHYMLPFYDTIQITIDKIPFQYVHEWKSIPHICIDSANHNSILPIRMRMRVRKEIMVRLFI
ncbi:hypothetical protein TetV_429 [Tetraselmis virus 1]|uniref:Uncharacterized protein n=1 Tax=Tetraselmis virus 1 TaxID=2060617 RepID=A0A2P0VNN3_9VIRU|nr:hypothetical protein QJ968_gp625 [Tetraselmis virus 1]AUF82511.1 hypothetical protein TetV_429 [Tetraselmis virus 1]